MSTEKSRDIIEWSWKIIIAIIISIGTWFGREVWVGQKEIAEKIHELQVSAAKIEGNRFTSQDWQRERTYIDSRLVVVETRAALSEQKMVEILKTVEKIDTKVSAWK